MIIDKLKITGFRNLEKEEFSFSPISNLIHGVNGAGKTSVLEAIFLLAYGKSFLNRKKADLVNDRSDHFAIHLYSSGPGGSNVITGFYQHNKKFALRLNQKSTGIFQINHCLYPVFFSSADYHLYIESMPYTRKMMDRFIFGIDSLYIKHLLSYNNVLKQKNQLLKNDGRTAELRSWNRIIGELSEKIVGTKMAFVEKLNTEIHEHFEKRLEVIYEPSFDIEQGISQQQFFQQLQELEPIETRSRRCLKGPNRDRYHIRLNNKHLKMYSSGEKKINLLMVYIAFIRLFKLEKKEYPVFLIDDFDVAMDSRNISRLIESYPEMQVIATSVNRHTDFSRFIQLMNKENIEEKI